MEKYLAAIGAFPGIKFDHWRKLTSYFKNLEEAWRAPISELLKADLAPEFVDGFAKFREEVDPVDIFLSYKNNGISVISINSTGYPNSLKEIYNPPFVIYAKGALRPEDENAIGIVGSRKGTDYGKRATFDIAKGLAEAGITVISGLALGLDTEAHKGALAGGGRTIAVLANGLKRVYPSSNQALATKIITNGCLISEQPFEMPPLRQNFPARNRIISGLSRGILVTEAGDRSGTLHTASFALEQNRQIYAVPGPIYNPLAKGPNNLLKNGAKAVTEADDILEDFGIEKTILEIIPEGEDEVLIFDTLKNENLQINEIVRRTKRPSGEISKILTMMEIKGKVRHLGGMVYSLR